MAKFRKKPVVIEAVEWNGTNVSDMRELFGGFTDWRLNNHNEGSGGLYIVTLEGEHRANPGDWVIKGTVGGFYPCKPEIFANIYDPA